MYNREKERIRKIVERMPIPNFRLIGFSRGNLSGIRRKQHEKCHIMLLRRKHIFRKRKNPSSMTLKSRLFKTFSPSTFHNGFRQFEMSSGRSIKSGAVIPLPFCKEDFSFAVLHYCRYTDSWIHISGQLRNNILPGRYPKQERMFIGIVPIPRPFDQYAGNAVFYRIENVFHVVVDQKRNVMCLHKRRLRDFLFRHMIRKKNPIVGNVRKMSVCPSNRSGFLDRHNFISCRYQEQFLREIVQMIHSLYRIRHKLRIRRRRRL